VKKDVVYHVRWTRKGQTVHPTRLQSPQRNRTHQIGRLKGEILPAGKKKRKKKMQALLSSKEKSRAEKWGGKKLTKKLSYQKPRERTDRSA